MEGTLDLTTAFPVMPQNLYLSALAYQTSDAGLLGSQAPAMVTDNGNVDPSEMLIIPIEVLRDEDGNGTYDLLEPGKGFVVTQSARTGNTFSISWKCFPGRSYRIQTCDDLTSGAWTNVPDSTFTAGPTETNASQNLTVDPMEPKRFFRVMLIP